VDQVINLVAQQVDEAKKQNHSIDVSYKTFCREEMLIVIANDSGGRLR